MLRFSVLLATFVLAITSCASNACRPGNHDGPWEYTQRAPMDREALARSLPGMTVDAARVLLAEGRVAPAHQEDSGITWTFEAHRKLTKVDCAGSPEVLYSQRLLIVKAEIRDGRIRSCSIQNRGILSKQLLAPEAIIEAPPMPLDSAVVECRVAP